LLIVDCRIAGVDVGVNISGGAVSSVEGRALKSASILGAGVSVVDCRLSDFEGVVNSSGGLTGGPCSAYPNICNEVDKYSGLGQARRSMSGLDEH
jgi:hypothetical protein